MKDLLTIVFFSVLLLSCGVVKDKKKKPVADKSKKTVVSAETKQLFHEAVQNYIISDYNSAIRMVNSYLTKNPSDDAAYYLLSKIYFEQKDSVNSIKMLETAKSIDGNNRWYHDYLGYYYLQNKDYSKALDSYLFLTKEVPDEVEYQFNLFQAYFGLKQYTKSLDVLDKIEKEIGENPETIYQRYATYINLKKYELAEQTLVQSLQKFPDERELLFTLGNFYSAQGKSQKMLSFLEDIIAKNPSAGNAKLLLCKYYLRENKGSKAEAMLVDVFSDSEFNPTYKHYFLMENFIDHAFIPVALAEKIALAAVHADPNDGFFNLFLGNIYDEAGDLKKALKYYEKATSNSKNKETYMRICALNYEMKEFDTLALFSKQALDLFPTNATFYYFNAVALLQQKKYDDCIDIAESGLAYTLDSYGKEDLNVLIAEAYFGKKDFKKGKDAYEALIKSNPRNLFLKNNLALILAKNNIELDYADKLINQIAELDPKNQNYQFTKAFILFRKGKYNEAQSILESIAKANPKDASLQNLLGDIAFKKGDANKALEYWNAAKELGFKNSILDRKIKDKKYYDEME